MEVLFATFHTLSHQTPEIDNLCGLNILIFCRFTGTQSKQDNDNYNGLSKRLRSYTCKLLTSDLDFLTSKGPSWS